MTTKYLYRGMSDLEFYDWLNEGQIPQQKDFTSEPEEAIDFGKRNVMKGNLVIFQTKFNDLYFQNTLHNAMNDFTGWYETIKGHNFGELETEILSPGEAIEFYNRNK